MTEAKKDKSASMKDLYGAANKAKSSASKTPVLAYRVLVRPLVTEKSSIGAGSGKYTFEVAVDANKIEVAKAIEEVYGVKPESVNVINMGGKTVRRGRLSGRRKDWRKAVVTLPAGKSIDVYEGV